MDTTTLLLWLLNLIVTFLILDDCDTVYLSHCYPYTYSQLCKYLNTIERDPALSKRFKRRVMC